MADENLTTTEHIEVEINSLELVEFMEELSTLQFVKTNLINESSNKELEMPITSNQIKQELTTFEENNYEEPIFDPIEEEEYWSNREFEQSYCKTESYFEEDALESTEFYAEDIKKSNQLFKENALKSIAIVKLKKLNGHLLQRFLATRKARVNLLKTLIETHARAELYPNIKEPVTLPNGLIMCHICYGVFNSNANVAKHIREIHERQKRFKCEKCEKRFNNLNNLTVHVYQSHSKIFRYECPKCEEFRTHRKVALFDHLRDIHLAPTEEIPSLIKSNYRLNNRQAGTVHNCTLCGYSSKHKHEFKRHMTGKHNIEPVENELICELCKKEFLNSDTKNKHLCVVRLRISERLDNMEWSSTCPDCDQTVYNKDELKSHYLQTHSENAPEVHAYFEEVRQNHEKRIESKIRGHYGGIDRFGGSKFEKLNPSSKSDEKSDEIMTTMLCDQCPFITSTIKELEAHVTKVHMHKYKYTCDHCLYSSKLMDRLSSHITKEHPLMPSQFCLKCPLTFMTVKEAGDHMRELHYEELKRIFCKYENCDYYNRKPRDLEFHYVRVHTKEKNFMCDKCDFRGMMAAEIDRHIRQKHFGIFAYTCHLCHREEIRMGFPTRKRFHRHLRAQHGINNPEDEDNEENREFIKNPTPIVNPVEPDKRNALLSENRKKSGITVKRKRKKKQDSKGDKIFVKKICSKVTISSQNGMLSL